MPTPVGPHEIAVMLNVSRQRVTQFRTEDKYGFPAPWVVLATGYIWRDTDIEAWAERTGRNYQHTPVPAREDS